MAGRDVPAHLDPLDREGMRMARKIVAGVVLALVALAVGVAFVGAAPSFTDNWNALPNDAYVVRDSVTCLKANADSVQPDGKHIYSWTIECRESSKYAGILYQFHALGVGDTTNQWDLCREGTSVTWYVQPLWVKLYGAAGTDSFTVHYTLRFEQDKF